VGFEISVIEETWVPQTGVARLGLGNVTEPKRIMWPALALELLHINPELMPLRSSASSAV